MLLKFENMNTTKETVDPRFSRGAGSTQVKPDLKPEVQAVPKEHICGAYSSSRIKEGEDFFGDEGCFIFSLFPVCKAFRALNTAGKKNFVHFGPSGLGFGGTQPGKCRVWIDQDMKQHSSVLEVPDDTYQPGSLLVKKGGAEPSSGLELQAVEVWVFGDETKKSVLQAAIIK